MLAGCSTATHPETGNDAYWNDQRWDGKLLDAVQSALHYPLDAAGQPVQPIPQTAQATVGFTYADGKIQDPRITKSSGRPDLDAAFLAQVAIATAPKAGGSHATEPHTFELMLEMRTPMQEFEYAEYTAISAERAYPREAVKSGEQGSVTVGFSYLDGKASDVKIVNSSRSKVLDRESLRAVADAHLPPQPTWLPRTPLNMTVVICYALGASDSCPQYQLVLQVSNVP